VNARLRSPAWLLEAFVAANLLVLVAELSRFPGGPRILFPNFLDGSMVGA
jgi:hypothetical protein